MELRGLWIFLFVFIFWANESVFSQDKKEKSSDSDSFVKEIEPVSYTHLTLPTKA